MVCTTKKAAATLAHKRWGTNPKGKTVAKKKRKVAGTAIKENEKEAPGVAARRKAGKPSVHFGNVVADLERRHGASVDKPKRQKKAKKKKSAPVINTLVPRRK